jgi:quercetin dioxygenase-like cupin family protein
MLAAEPLPGWSGRFLHDVRPSRPPPRRCTSTIVDGEVALTVDGEEQVLDVGCIAVGPPDTSHSVRPLGACRVVVIADYPRRPDLPGLSSPQ